MSKQTEGDENCKRLKLVHLLYLIIVLAVSIGIAWGFVVNQQSTNSKEIEKKLDKEIFTQYQEEQRRATDNLDKSINRGFDRLDKRIEGISK